MIEIVVEGPAYRVNEAKTEPDDGTAQRREMAVTGATYVVEQQCYEPIADAGTFLTDSAFTIGQELLDDDPLVGEWDLSAGDPNEWVVNVGGDPETWIDSAELAADTLDRDDVDPFDVLTEWLQAARETGRNGAGLEAAIDRLDRSTDVEADEVEA